MDEAFLIKKLPYLPTEIITNILSRLPIQTIISCKCVCKTWFKLLNTPDFIKSHLSKSVPGLILYQEDSRRRYSPFFTIFDFEDDDDQLKHEQHELRYVPVTEFEHEMFVISRDYTLIKMAGSTNGLLFLRDIRTRPNALYICNPITREYINLSNPGEIFYYPSVVTYGFGVSKTTDQYKVVRIFHECVRDQATGSLLSIPKSECRVYTLGTGSWSSIPLDSSYEYNCRSNGAFLNGNLHWLVLDLKRTLLISCFDLDTELFKVFSPPPDLQGSRAILGAVTILGDRLCLCDNTSDNEIVIWIMKEYGVEKSWTKEFVISKFSDHAGQSYEVVFPIKVFKDGDILLLYDELGLSYYSNNTKTITNVDVFQLKGSFNIQARLHVSSFLSLKSFEMEDVAKF